MAQVSIDLERCKKDGLCAAVCPVGLIRMNKETGLPVPVEYGEAACIVCGHCQAACPHGALTLTKERDGVTLDGFIPIRRELAVTTDQAEQFLRSRRSVRAYKDKPVDRELVERMIDMASHAPSGHNDQPVHWTVVPDRESLVRLGDRVAEWMHGESRKRTELAAKYHLPGVVRAWKKGKDLLFRGAPCLVACHTPESCDTGAQDGALAMAYAELAAHGMGLGACWCGYFLFAAWMNPDIGKPLNIPDGHRVQAAMFVGHPASRYVAIPPRVKPRIAWVGLD